MIAAGQTPAPAAGRRPPAPIASIDALLPPHDAIAREAGRMTEVATPVSFGGFTPGTLELFAPQLRALGLEPRQGVLGGGSASASTRTPTLEPGSMISVQLVSGDMSVGADGTVTHIDGAKVYAFGHRFLSVGQTEMPFAKAEVLTLLPNLATSFKISAARELAGTMTGDHSAAVTGELGRQARLVPIALRVRGGQERAYRMNVVNDRFLTPFLLAMVVHSSIDATERMVGVTTVRSKARFLFNGGAPPATIENVWTGEANVGVQAALGAASPLSYAMQSGFPEFRLGSVEIDLDVVNEKRQYAIEQVWASSRIVRPGDDLEVHTVIAGPGGFEAARKVTYRVPVGAVTGPLNITVSDATSANMAEFQQLLGQAPGTEAEVTDFLRRLRTNDAAYARFWRADPSYQVSGRLLPDPPASLALILARTQQSGGAPPPIGSRIAERAFDPVDGMVTGAKTIQVEIKE
jgi:hypothetical protein